MFESLARGWRGKLLENNEGRGRDEGHGRQYLREVSTPVIRMVVTVMVKREQLLIMSSDEP